MSITLKPYQLRTLSYIKLHYRGNPIIESVVEKYQTLNVTSNGYILIDNAVGNRISSDELPLEALHGGHMPIDAHEQHSPRVGLHAQSHDILP